MKKLIIIPFMVIAAAAIVMLALKDRDTMTIRSQISVETQSELYNFGLAHNQVTSVFGVAAMGDIPIKFYYYDTNSSATDDGENVIKPTSVVSNGRHIKISPTYC